MAYDLNDQLVGPYLEHESELRLEALGKGVLQPLLADLNKIQSIEDERVAAETYEPRLRIALVTARNAPAHERAIHSMRDWGVRVNDAFFLGGIEKAKVLRVMRPHIFFDDQTTHLDGAADDIAGVRIPYGVANETNTPTPAPHTLLPTQGFTDPAKHALEGV